ncbi:hypothetical protein ACIPW5_26725 [Streptomyces sp. NPDC090077]|uniref:hypothetical protein n=1 Tax=Streptomyces sp. NPDC090077 TaxID=3365938 RepID=UPI00380CDA14
MATATRYAHPSPAPEPPGPSPGAAASPVRLSAAVMCHPSREAAARALAGRFPDLHATVVLDPAPDGPPDALRTALRAWSAVVPGATHHLVLQDDALPAEDFLRRLHALVAAQPDAALSLFTEWGSRTSYALRIAAMSGHHLAPVVDDYVPCVGLVLPAGVARGFADHARAEAADGDPDDLALLHYLAARGVRTLVPVANLVDHDNGAPSLVGNSVHGPRSAACLVPPDLAALPAEPTVLTGLGTVPYYDFWGQYSDACIPDDSTVDGRVRSSARVFLRGHGVTQDELSAGLAAALERCPERAFLTERVSEIVLTEVWIVSFLLGFTAAGLEGRGGASLDLTGPLPAAALATLGPGAVRRVVPRWLLPAVGALLTPLVLEAVRAGAARAPLRS